MNHLLETRERMTCASVTCIGGRCSFFQKLGLCTVGYLSSKERCLHRRYAIPLTLLRSSNILGHVYLHRMDPQHTPFQKSILYKNSIRWTFQIQITSLEAKILVAPKSSTDLNSHWNIQCFDRFKSWRIRFLKTSDSEHQHFACKPVLDSLIPWFAHLKR